MPRCRTILVAALLTFVSVPAFAQSLAEASAAAKLVTHEWPAFVYTHVDLKDVPAVTAPVTVDTDAPPPSTLARKQTEAAALLASPIAALTALATAHSATQTKYGIACAGKTSAVVIGLRVLELVNEGTPECRYLRDEMGRQATALTAERAAVAETARRQGIYPGIVRGLLAAAGLEDGVTRVAPPAAR